MFCRSKKFHNFVECCLVKDYLNRGNCEQLLKHPLIRDCQEKQVKLQIKEYLDKIRKIRRGSNSTSNDVVVVPPVQQIQSDDEDEDEDDDDNDNDRVESRGEEGGGGATINDHSETKSNLETVIYQHS